MNAIDLLKSQHKAVRDLFQHIEETEDFDEKQALFEELADNFAAHATIEEKLFYPAAYANRTKELLTEAVEEHLAAKRILADLIDLSPEHESFDAKIKVLQEQIEHHVEEEENELFEAVGKELDGDELETLGTEMEELFDREMAASPSERLPEQTDEAAPLG